MTTMMLPVSPKEAMNVLNGDQTILVRRSVPKAKWPIKVYLYCSDSKDFLLDNDDGQYFLWDKHDHHYFYKYTGDFQKKVLASFVLSETDAVWSAWWILGHKLDKSAKDIRKEEEVCDDAQRIAEIDYYDEIVRKSCMTRRELLDYAKSSGKWIQVLRISDLRILDRPYAVSEFFERFRWTVSTKTLSRAPSTWRYVEEPRELW